MDKKKLLLKLFFIAITIIFLLTTLKPIIYQTVGYTYDQGRDFLKAAEIVMNRKPTFLGPTTGINGLYHGAWWYYILITPFIIFGGAPQGFYYFNLFLQLTCFVVFFLFTKKNLSIIPAFLFFLLICTSPYFIFISLFVGNNIMVIPMLLGFLITNYILLEEARRKKLLLLSFLVGLFLGLVGEFELSFGIFLLPTYFLAIIIFKNLRTHFAKINQLVFFILGLLIAFGPRILFEMKHQFQQTRILFRLVTANRTNDPRPYWNIVQDRFILFKDNYYGTIFIYEWIGILFFVLTIIALVYIWKNKIMFKKTAFLFMLYLIGTLFFLSTLYKDFFWHNYYEGIQLIIVFALAILFSAKFKQKKIVNFVGISMMFIISVSYLTSFLPTVFKTPKADGLAIQTAVVNYILNTEKNKKNYCVRIYTPPVIPYTYDYLFLYNKLSRGVGLPQKEWVNGTCWFIMETDPFEFRLKEWREINNPKEKANTTTKKIKDVTVTHYEIQ